MDVRCHPAPGEQKMTFFNQGSQPGDLTTGPDRVMLKTENYYGCQSRRKCDRMLIKNSQLFNDPPDEGNLIAITMV